MQSKIKNLDGMYVSVYEMAVMYTNLFLAFYDKKTYYDDIDHSPEFITSIAKSQHFPVEYKYIEKLLCACNYRNEDGRFWAPDGRNFDSFVKMLLHHHKELYFDKDYNMIRLKEKKL